MSYDFWDQPPPQGSLFARRLRQIRAGSGLSVTELAARAGIDAGAYRACEAGRDKISATMLMRVARALDLAPSVFFDPE